MYIHRTHVHVHVHVHVFICVHVHTLVLGGGPTKSSIVTSTEILAPSIGSHSLERSLI